MSTKDLFTELPFSFDERTKAGGPAAFDELGLAMEEGVQDGHVYSLTRSPREALPFSKQESQATALT